MNRQLAGAAVASLALTATIIPGAGAKAAKKPAPAGVYRAQLGAVGAIPARGDAQLVDGPKHDKVSIHVRGLQPGVTYAWHVRRQVTCIAAPCDPPLEPGWTYRNLKANKAGNANAKGTSPGFTAEPGGTYLIDVQLPTGEVIARGPFQRKASPPETKQPAHG
jgi:hypothetical protein